jgi:hypothetical protein
MIERTGTPEINVQKFMAFSKAKEMLLYGLQKMGE